AGGGLLPDPPVAALGNRSRLRQPGHPAGARDERDPPRATPVSPHGQSDRALLERHDPRLAAHAASIGDEFLSGFEAVEGIGRPGVTIFGSARIRADHPIYAAAEDAGRRFAEAGFAVITGGGPGVMEAANRGAQETGGVSVGFNIELAHEQKPNPYLDI